MRRGTILVLGLSLLVSSLIPNEAAQARPRGLGAVLGVLTMPLALLGARRHAARLGHHRRAYAERASARARWAARSAAPAAAGVAAGAGAAAAVGASTP